MGSKFLTRRRFALLLRSIGPGVITGAADDDPSGIATYSVAGAQFGTHLLWAAFLTWPMMAAVQVMCARIGRVTGRGLAGSLRQRVPRWVLVSFDVALLAANTINIAADLAGMGDAAEMISGVNSHWFVLIFAVLISWAMVRLSYRRVADVLKWLVLVLFAYPVTAFVVGFDWHHIARAAFIPSMPRSLGEWSVLVAILGTTISPYLFFWQASAEVEEEKEAGHVTVAQRRGATDEELEMMKIDVGVGTFFSNVVMFFIILTTAVTLHGHGITQIQTSRQAAEALRPFAGNFATAIFTIGIVGVGFLAIPTLAGSAAYAFADTFRWNQGLNRKLKQARAFYAVIIVSTAIAAVIGEINMNPVKALYWAAVINGLLAPFLLIPILIVAADKKLMVDQPVSRTSWVVVAFTTVVMLVAGVAMFIV